MSQAGASAFLKPWRLLYPVAAFFAAFFLLKDYGFEQRLVGGVFAATITLWISEILPMAVTGLVAMCLVLLCGIDKLGEKEVFAAFGDQIVPLFIGSFMIAKAMEVSGISNRFAYWILSQRWAAGSASRLLLSLGMISCVISLFVSNTATTAMLLPIGMSMLKAIKADEKGLPYGTALMLMLTWGSSVAVGFPVGTPPNLIGIGQIEKATGTKISFLQWMGFAMPITVIMVLLCWLVLWLLYRKGAPQTADAIEAAREKLQALGAFSRRERNVLGVFFVALSLWILPDLSAMILGKEQPIAAWLQAAVPASAAALIGAALLFILPAEGGPTLSWENAAKIDWGIILVFVGGIALGKAAFETGLAKSLGEAAAVASGANSVWTITLLCSIAAVLLSELASNTAAATTLVPVAIGISQGAGVSPIPAALGVALAASLGFMLPISTGPNAIVYSSGLVPPRQMMKSGLLIDILGAVVTFLCLWAILPLLKLS